MQYYTTHCGFEIAYQLKYTQRRTIGFHVNAQGLEIRVPKRIPSATIHAAIEAKKHWIERQLKRLTTRQIWWQAPEEVWRIGGLLPYLGQTLRLQPGAQQYTYLADTIPRCLDYPSTLYVPGTARCPETIFGACKKWLQAQGRDYLTQRLQSLAQPHGLRFQKLRLGWSKRHWGWCRSDGTIMLNWRLMHYPPALIDYLVAHELAHLVHMNHSPEFWQWVEIIYPEYRSAKQQLARYHPTCIPIFSTQE